MGPPWNTRTMFPPVTIKRVSEAICMCVCVCVPVPNSVYGPIISHVVYCRAAQTDALQCISSQAPAVFVPTIITTHTHTHRESLQFTSTERSSRVICWWLWVYLLCNAEWIHSISKLYLPLSLIPVLLLASTVFIKYCICSVSIPHVCIPERENRFLVLRCKKNVIVVKEPNNDWW